MKKTILVLIASVVLFSNCARQDNAKSENAPVAEKLDIDQLVADIDQYHRNALKDKYYVLKSKVMTDMGTVKSDVAPLYVANLVGEEALTIPTEYYMEGMSLCQSPQVLTMHLDHSFMDHLYHYNIGLEPGSSFFDFQKECVVRYLDTFDTFFSEDNPLFNNLEYEEALVVFKTKVRELYNEVRTDPRLSDAERVALMSTIKISVGSLEEWPALLAEANGTKGFWNDAWKKAVKYAKADAAGAIIGVASSYKGIIAAGVATGGSGALAVAGTAAATGAVIGSLACGVSEIMSFVSEVPFHPVVVGYKSML
ncbi:MAG: hypothetical protein ACEPOZ_04815 [Marinifilaceae bacterium]